MSIQQEGAGWSALALLLVPPNQHRCFLRVRTGLQQQGSVLLHADLRQAPHTALLITCAVHGALHYPPASWAGEGPKLTANMAPFATLYTFTNIRHAKETKIMATAYLSGLDVHIDPNYVQGETNNSPQFLSKFPMGQTPALETPSGFLLSEGTAICHYLACKGPKRAQLLGSTPEEEAIIQMWISLGESEIFPNAYGIIVPMMGREPYVEWAVRKKEDALEKAADRMELYLQDCEWLGGNEGLNLADLSMASAVYWPLMFLWDERKRAKWPKLVDWYKRLLQQDEGVKKAFGGDPQFCQQRLPPFPADGKRIM